MIQCLLLFSIAVSLASAQKQAIDYFEVRNGRLFLTIEGEPRVISTSAIRAWPGWTPQIVLYSEQADKSERLRWYDAFTRNSQTVGTMDVHIADLTTVRLSTGDYAILIQGRDNASKLPSVALATPTRVFYREPNATYGTAANDTVEIRRYDLEELERTKGDVTLLAPAVSVNIPLTDAPANAAGIYEARFPAADSPGRTITLNLRGDGSATLITAFDGRDPIARRGQWKQTDAVIRLDLESPPDTLVWTLTADGLTPRSWNKATYGATGLTLHRAQAQVPVPRRAPGTIR